MDISVIGASGVIGRQIVISIVEQGLLSPDARLQLVGHRGGSSEKTLYGFAADLHDAYAEILPEIDVALSPEELVGDIIIVAGGRTVTTDPDAKIDRNALADYNREMFTAYAQALHENAHGEEIVLIVSNPVELGVHVFSQYHPRSRVIGMGAFLDTMRFRAEIARELGVRRNAVHGFVLGEHGFHLVPCWSTVRVFGFDAPEGRERVAALQREAPDRMEAFQACIEIERKQGPQAAYRHCAQYPAGLRTVIEPFLTHFTGWRTPLGTSSMILRMVKVILSGDEVLCAGQARLEGEFLGIHGVTGVPLVISNRGIARVESVELTAPEQAALHEAVASARRVIGEAWR